MRGLIIGQKIIELENEKAKINEQKEDLALKSEEDDSDMSENSGAVALKQELGKLTYEEELLNNKIRILEDMRNIDNKISSKYVCKDAIVKLTQNGEEVIYVITNYTDLSSTSLSMIDINSDFGKALIGHKVNDSFVVENYNIIIKEIL